MSQSFNKKEKLKSEKAISDLFLKARSVTQHPLRLLFHEYGASENTKTKIAVSVSKRNFKKAVDRNRIKRLLREAYRLNKSQLFNNTDGEYAFMILYLGKDIPDFDLINTKLKLLFGKFSAIVTEEKK
jgi:ribonuclease P protein component